MSRNSRHENSPANEVHELRQEVKWLREELDAHLRCGLSREEVENEVRREAADLIQIILDSRPDSELKKLFEELRDDLMLPRNKTKNPLFDLLSKDHLR